MANSTIDNPHMEDTGWIVLNNTYPLRYRAKRGMVTVSLRLIGGDTPSSGQLLGTLPARYRPPFQIVCPTQNLRAAFSINEQGEIGLTNNSGFELNNYMAAIVSYPYED